MPFIRGVVAVAVAIPLREHINLIIEVPFFPHDPVTVRLIFFPLFLRNYFLNFFRVPDVHFTAVYFYASIIEGCVYIIIV